MWASISIIRDIVYGASRRGVNPKDLFQAAGISLDKLEQAEGRVSFEEACSVWKEAVTHTGDNNLGLHIGENSTPTVVGLVGHLMESSADVYSAFQNLCEYSSAVTEMFFYSCETDNDRFLLNFEPAPLWIINSPETARHAVDQAMAGSLHVIQLLCGKKVLPLRAEFNRNKESEIGEYERVFNSQLVFQAGKNRLIFKKEIGSLPVIGFNNELQDLFKQHLNLVIKNNQILLSYSSLVKNVLLLHYHGGFLSLPETAEKLNITVRHLQRKLKEENSGFTEILDMVRKELADSLLKNVRLTIEEVADMLGYSEATAFRRAYHRMTGTTSKVLKEK